MLNVVIIGGGASGLIAAITAARSGHTVTILERMDKIGKKLLATGNGRCNYTNLHIDTACFRSRQMLRLQAILAESKESIDVLDFFKEIGIWPRDRNGYVYPLSDQAVAVRDALLLEARHLRVRIRLDANVTHIHHLPPNVGEGAFPPQGFVIDIENQKSILADRLILACGGCAYPKLGSNGSGYKLAGSLGLAVHKPLPALTALYTKEKDLFKAAGVRISGRISLYGEELLGSDQGEIQLTDYGISGIPVFQVSRYAAERLENGQRVSAILDFLPDISDEDLPGLLRIRQKQLNDRTAGEFLIGMFHHKLAPILCQRADLPIHQSVAQITEEQLKKLCRQIKGFRLKITKTGSFEQAQVCAGGVDLGELTSDLEAKRIPGLFITGELLDVDGICGGYNLHWAWITGYLAGLGARREDL